MSIDTSISNFTGTVTRLTDTPLVAAVMFPPAALAGLEPDALANINGPSVLRMPNWAANISMRMSPHRMCILMSQTEGS